MGLEISTLILNIYALQTVKLIIAFCDEARDRFRQQGWLISTALAPKTSATQVGEWYEAHDYRAHGQIVDFVVIMTYEWGYSGGPAMAVSPIDQVRKVLEYALTEMPGQENYDGPKPLWL